MILSLLLTKISQKHRGELFIFLLILFLTPTQPDPSLLELSPSLFSFIFNILFEQDFSTRVLRPLLISIPLGLLSIALVLFIRKRFF